MTATSNDPGRGFCTTSAALGHSGAFAARCRLAVPPAGSNDVQRTAWSEVVTPWAHTARSTVAPMAYGVTCGILWTL
jgi:hypothetical protein